MAQPLGPGPYGGVVVIHHIPGYDEGSLEITRKFTAHGYLALCPNLYSRDAPEKTPEEAATLMRARGGVPDERLVGDVEGAAEYLRSLPSSNRKVGVIGFCSGRRHAFLAACRLPLDAAVDCYGAFIVSPPPEGVGLKATPLLHLAADLSCPLLGLFGAEDHGPSPTETATLASVLAEHGKNVLELNIVRIWTEPWQVQPSVASYPEIRTTTHHRTLNMPRLRAEGGTVHRGDGPRGDRRGPTSWPGSSGPFPASLSPSGR